MPNYRNLTPSEINIARSVFQQSIDFKYVFIADTFLPFNNNVAVTLMHDERHWIMEIPIHVNYWFAIYWGRDVYQSGANSNLDWLNTLMALHIKCLNADF